MVLEDGPFRPVDSPDRRAGSYGARITIPGLECARLGVVPGAITQGAAPCLAWCRERFGPYGQRWFVSAAERGGAVIHFKLMVDALAFLGAWCLVAEERIAA